MDDSNKVMPFGRPAPQGARPAQGQPVNIELSTCEGIVCEDCKSEYFRTNFMIKKISAIMSPTGRETLVPVEFYVCANCGAPTKILKGN